MIRTKESRLHIVTAHAHRNPEPIHRAAAVVLCYRLPAVVRGRLATVGRPYPCPCGELLRAFILVSENRPCFSQFGVCYL
jgi:hypothetical protein